MFATLTGECGALAMEAEHLPLSSLGWALLSLRLLKAD